jgi:hypothetical protein
MRVSKNSVKSKKGKPSPLTRASEGKIKAGHGLTIVQKKLNKRVL